VKRLLFVDDEQMVLSGLRRALHDMHMAWDMTFVNSATAALEVLETAEYDAIVSDIRMPLIDGAQLLEQVKERYPAVMRFVLSGQSSRETVLRSIAPAHQFLSKPCDPEELKRRLKQAFAMRDLLLNESVKTLVSRLRSIPSLPALYDELTAELSGDDISLTRIAAIISRDVGMAAKILQLANSAFIGVRGQVSNVVQAISLIGTETVRTLVLSVHVFSHFDRSSDATVWLPPLWEHSVAVAALAQRIANCEHATKAIAEESFTAGLLHDVGKVVLLAEMGRNYRQLLENKDVSPNAIADLERELLGCTHAQVGAYLMSIWGLPPPLVHAVAFHHQPSEAGETVFSSLSAVHVADVFASENESSLLLHDVELDWIYLDQTDLRSRLSSWRELQLDPTEVEVKGESSERKNPVCG